MAVHSMDILRELEFVNVWLAPEEVIWLAATALPLQATSNFEQLCRPRLPIVKHLMARKEIGPRASFASGSLSWGHI